MDIKKCTRGKFSVIGKEGSTEDTPEFVKSLWAEANEHFIEVIELAKKDENGNPATWGAMGDFSRSFKPWDGGFTNGLYLAGVEVEDDVEAPDGWVKWVIPACEYICVKSEGPDTFCKVINCLKEDGVALVDTVPDYTCTIEQGQEYMYFPVKRV